MIKQYLWQRKNLECRIQNVEFDFHFLCQSTLVNNLTLTTIDGGLSHE